tara:strand:+ start:790 stop:945 length:156 start_codon:yes stop_codon:yes gene_type:complete
MLVRIAQAISSACNFISIRMDWYAEKKQYEFETRTKTFPKEWFEDLPNEEE